MPADPESEPESEAEPKHNKTRKRRSAKVVCRGSAASRGGMVAIKSVMNQMVPEMGAIGVKAVWPLLHEYLSKEGIEEVEILGKSMGGSTAQQLAVLAEAAGGIHVSRLVTVCSVGAGASVNSAFRDRVLAKRQPDTPFDIVVIRNGRDENGAHVDYVPTIGGVHMGYQTDPDKCRIEIRYIGGTDSKPPSREQAGLSRPVRLKRFYGSFGHGHGRQTTLMKEWSWESITDRAEVDELLGLGCSGVEQLRGGLVAVNGIWLRGHGFGDFIDSLRNQGGAAGVGEKMVS